MTPNASRAFAIRWSEIEQWDVLSASLLSQYKLSHPLVNLGSVMSVRWEKASNAQLETREVKMVERVSFDGEIFSGNKETTKMTQWIGKPSDLLVSKIRARQGSIGLVSEKDGLVSVSIHYRVLTPDKQKIDPLFVWIVLRSDYCRSQFLSATGGAMKGEISEERLLSIKIPLPSLSTQQAIVAHWQKAQTECAAFENEITTQETASRHRFLAALGLSSEQRKFDKKCFALRWSETPRWSIEFLRRHIAQSEHKTIYPHHPLSELTEGRNGSTPDTRQPAYWNGDIPWVSPKDMKTDEITTTQDKITETAIKHGRVPLIKAPSVLLVMRSGILQHSAPVAHTALDVAINQDMRAFTVKNGVPLDARFLAIYLQNNTPLLLNLVKWGTTVQSMNTAELENLKIPLPPLDVQHRLVAQVQADRAAIATLRSRATHLRATITQEVEEMILGRRAAPGFKSLTPSEIKTLEGKS